MLTLWVHQHISEAWFDVIFLFIAMIINFSLARLILCKMEPELPTEQKGSSGNLRSNGDVTDGLLGPPLYSQCVWIKV